MKMNEEIKRAGYFEYLIGKTKSNPDVLKRVLENFKKLFIGHVNDIDGIGYFKNLESLRVKSYKLKDIQEISELSNLINLDISQTKVKDISPIKNLKNLKKLNISDTLIKDLSPLTGLPSLEKIIIRDNENIVDPINLISLLNAPSLKTINIKDTPLAKKLNKRFLPFVQEFEEKGINIIVDSLNLNNRLHDPEYDRGIFFDNLLIDFDNIEETNNSLDINKRLLSQALADYFEPKSYHNKKFDYSKASQINKLNCELFHLKDLEGIEHFENLRLLYIGMNGFSDLTPISKLNNLEVLSLQYIQANNWEVLSKMSNLKTLSLTCSNISASSLNYLTNLNKLESLGLIGVESINTQNDLEFLLKLPNLKQVNIEAVPLLEKNNNPENMDIVKNLKQKDIKIIPIDKDTNYYLPEYFTIPSLF